jgi:hypothetical protein
VSPLAQAFRQLSTTEQSFPMVEQAGVPHSPSTHVSPEQHWLEVEQAAPLDTHAGGVTQRPPLHVSPEQQSLDVAHVPLVSAPHASRPETQAPPAVWASATQVEQAAVSVAHTPPVDVGQAARMQFTSAE